MAFLTRDSLMSRVSTNVNEKVNIKEWGGDIGIATVKMVEFEGFRQALKDMDAEKDNSKAFIDLIIKFCVDKDGERLFTEDDRSWLEQQPVKVVSKLVNHIIRANSMNDEEAEDAEKNSEKADS